VSDEGRCHWCDTPWGQRTGEHAELCPCHAAYAAGLRAAVETAARFRSCNNHLYERGDCPDCEAARDRVEQITVALESIAALAARGRAPEGGPLAKPRIVCLCGSTRFMEAFQAANLDETISGRIVLSVGCNTKSDADLARLGQLTPETKAALDELHKRKIDLADEVLVLNVGGYVGASTRGEIEYARAHGKPIRWLEAPECAR
jgi:hypothetical protein